MLKLVALSERMTVSVDKGRAINFISLAVYKAFDKVPHYILTSK